MRTAAADDDPLDRRPADAARLAGALVDVQDLLEAAAPPRRVDEALDAGALVVDAGLKGLEEGRVQTLRLTRPDAPRRPQRVQAGAEQRFVRVDVADAGDPALVREGRT